MRVARAVLRRRIGGLEALLHLPECVGRKAAFERAARTIDQEGIVTFLDARRWKQEMPRNHGGDEPAGREPAPRLARGFAGEDHDRGQHQQRVVEQLVDRQADRRDD